mmetsp:Transcript_931/g.855  ORF Transcript_931/g.855 Transcript_931/m.855 type:complete len:199 (-) Transcript_931:231-827(-)|eukprot:CAMPEP_0197822982 /NCGR_PEP_ID=MMETSP1437-20131217/292_1 /TAXON_ID=49252 ORGANISM="Eucampia antarctica, Strain CCMP1452" /NCGR_SAMPLE_ID=MMETSP1437 /ASSEMBLY_ACC=CAM_ASM_001096 /LENGTH=198 /DNA_ID=CAMNT_0043421899 /DNA_START=39 /DNA_END=635 /DNA_ORIENTATION=-
MKTAAILTTLLASASAFAPSVSKPSATAVKASVWEEYEGGVDLFGRDFKYDPLGLADTYEPFRGWFRECETRHGRTAMLAVVGFITADFARIPGDAYSFASIPKVIDAHDALLKGPMYQLLLWIGLFDLIVTIPAVQAMGKGEREPGDFAFGSDFLGTDPANIAKAKTQELLHGRLAMCAVGGIATQSIISGAGFPYH